MNDSVKSKRAKDTIELFDNFWQKRHNESIFTDNGFINNRCVNLAIEALGEISYKKVLIIGAGRGFEAEAFLLKKCRVLATDITASGLKYYKDSSLIRVVMDAERLSFREKAFDIILGSTMLMYANKGKVYQEVHRTLKNNGTYIILEPTITSYLFKLLHLISKIKRRATHSKYHYIEQHKTANLFNDNDVTTLKQLFSQFTYYNSIGITPVFHLLRKLGLKSLMNYYFILEKRLIATFPKLKKQGIHSIYIFKK